MISLIATETTPWRLAPLVLRSASPLITSNYEARWLRKTLESMATPSWVKACGRYLMFRPRFKLPNWNLKDRASACGTATSDGVVAAGIGRIRRIGPIGRRGRARNRRLKIAATASRPTRLEISEGRRWQARRRSANSVTSAPLAHVKADGALGGSGGKFGRIGHGRTRTCTDFHGRMAPRMDEAVNGHGNGDGPRSASAATATRLHLCGHDGTPISESG